MDLSKEVGEVIICGNSPVLLLLPLPHQMCQIERNIRYIVTHYILTRYTPNRKRNTDVTKVTFSGHILLDLDRDISLAY